MMVTNVLNDARGFALNNERRVNDSQFLSSVPPVSATMGRAYRPGVAMMESDSVQPMVSPAAAVMLLCELIRHGWTPPGMLRASAMASPMAVNGNNCAMERSNMMGHSMGARSMGGMSGMGGMVEAMPSQEMPMGAAATRVSMHDGMMGGSSMGGSSMGVAAMASPMARGMATDMATGMATGMDSRTMGPGGMGEMTGGEMQPGAPGPSAGMVSMGMRDGMTNP
jgi:hypothetical protein